MTQLRDYHFVRANGATGHNDPSKPNCYVKGEPPRWPSKFFNYAGYCLANGLIRIGWPGTGDLREVPDVPTRTPCYAVLTDKIRGYLRKFRDAETGSGVLMPDKERAGVLFVGTVTTPYHYFHDVPRHPYECAHRLGVEWDRRGGVPVEYHADDFGVSIRGGWWMWAYHKLHAERYETLVRRIEARRAQAA